MNTAVYIYRLCRCSIVLRLVITGFFRALCACGGKVCNGGHYAGSGPQVNRGRIAPNHRGQNLGVAA